MIKAGHLNQEMQFNEITALVMELLASASQDMRQSEQVRTMELADEASLLETQQHHTGDSCGGSTGTDIQIIKPSLNPKSDNLENFRNGIVPVSETFGFLCKISSISYRSCKDRYHRQPSGY